MQESNETVFNETQIQQGDKGKGCLVLIVLGLIGSLLMMGVSIFEQGTYGTMYGEWGVKTSQGDYYFEVDTEGIQVASKFTASDIYIGQSSEVNWLKNKGTFTANQFNGETEITFEMSPGIQVLDRSLTNVNGHIQVKNGDQTILNEDVIYQKLNASKTLSQKEHILGQWAVQLSVDKVYREKNGVDKDKTIDLDFVVKNDLQVQGYESSDHLYAEYDLFTYMRNKGEITYVNIRELEPEIDIELDTSRESKPPYIEYKFYLMPTESGMNGYYIMNVSGNSYYSGRANVMIKTIN